MYRSILVPLDGTAFSETALPVARAIAERTGAPLELAHVHVPEELPPDLRPFTPFQYEGVVAAYDSDEEAHRGAKRTYLQLTAAEAASASRSTTVSAALLDGPIADSLVAFARQTGAELIVMATHAPTGFKRFWTGSSAEALLRRASIPLLLIRPLADAAPRTKGFEHVLITLDGSALAEEVIEAATKLGSAASAWYTLLRVVSPFKAVHVPPDPGIPFTADLKDTEWRSIEAETYLEDVAARMRARGLPVETRIVLDINPPTAIAHFAEHNGVDVIAMATHGRSGVSRFLVGSVADAVLHATHLPMLLIHPQGAPHAAATPAKQNGG